MSWVSVCSSACLWRQRWAFLLFPGTLLSSWDWAVDAALKPRLHHQYLLRRMQEVITDEAGRRSLVDALFESHLRVRSEISTAAGDNTRYISRRSCNAT